MNLHEHNSEFESAINMTAQTLQIQRHFVEKDYWICRSLQLMMRQNAGHRAVFKGGTSLTKAYGIGSRFSEDIDIAILDADTLSGNQLKNLIHHIAHAMTEGLTEVVKEGVTSKGSHYHKAFYSYPVISAVPTSTAVCAGELLLEINSFGNPYPWQMCTIRSFIAEFLYQSGNEALVKQFDMEDFEVPVLDKCRTMTEKIVSLMRCSLADDYMPQLQAKIRHFYDLHHLLADSVCHTYLQSETFRQDFQALLAHDRAYFDKPAGWQQRALSESPLINNLRDTWHALQPTYLRELPDLAYREIPSVDAIETSIKTISGYIV
ncbi:MAG: nucleotidyl transferase AbiEii/AbiGii toxin family protein [Bacteroidales bacterium]|nr:nucleotidyl transferase AbiEii/AbiGii toxin family protein [Candidatus Colicola coprequi]